MYNLFSIFSAHLFVFSCFIHESISLLFHSRSIMYHLLMNFSSLLFMLHSCIIHIIIPLSFFYTLLFIHSSFPSLRNNTHTHSFPSTKSWWNFEPKSFLELCFWDVTLHVLQVCCLFTFDFVSSSLKWMWNDYSFVFWLVGTIFFFLITSRNNILMYNEALIHAHIVTYEHTR